MEDAGQQTTVEGKRGNNFTVESLKDEAQRTSKSTSKDASRSKKNASVSTVSPRRSSKETPRGMSVSNSSNFGLVPFSNTDVSRECFTSSSRREKSSPTEREMHSSTQSDEASDLLHPPSGGNLSLFESSPSISNKVIPGGTRKSMSLLDARGEDEEYRTDSSDDIYVRRSETWYKSRRKKKGQNSLRARIDDEKDETMKRIEEALRKSEDLLLSDLQAEQEITQELKGNMLQLLFMHQEDSMQREDELAGLGQWFRTQSDSAKMYASMLDESFDIEDYNVNAVSAIISNMTGLRARVTEISKELIDSATSRSKHENFEKRLHDQQEMFRAEVQKMMEQMHQLEKHADELKKQNLDMKQSLALAEEKKNLWHRRFEELETKEQSLFAQMEDTIQQRTHALNEAMLRQAMTAEQTIDLLQEQADQVREEQFQLKELLRIQDSEMIKFRADLAIATDKLDSMNEENRRLRYTAGPAAEMLVRLRQELDVKNSKEKQLEAELKLIRVANMQEGDHWMVKAREYKKMVDDREEEIRAIRNSKVAMDTSLQAEMDRMLRENHERMKILEQKDEEIARVTNELDEAVLQSRQSAERHEMFLERLSSVDSQFDEIQMQLAGSHQEIEKLVVVAQARDDAIVFLEERVKALEAAIHDNINEMMVKDQVCERACVRVCVGAFVCFASVRVCVRVGHCACVRAYFSRLCACVPAGRNG